MIKITIVLVLIIIIVYMCSGGNNNGGGRGNTSTRDVFKGGAVYGKDYGYGF